MKSGVTNVQNDLADAATCFAECVCFDHILESEFSANNGTNLACINKRRQFIEDSRIGFDEHKRAANTKGFGFLFGRRTDDGNEHATWFEYRPRGFLNLAAEGVEHDIDLIDDVCEFLCLVVNHLIGAQRVHEGKISS